MHAHALDALDLSPYLALTSPEKRCGKTTTLTLLHGLVPRPVPASNITAAALFRAVEKYVPTLLVDTADTFVANSPELRGILTSGHTRATAFAVRTVGDEHEAKTFSTFCAKAIALISGLPGTLEDRSIVLALRRKTRKESVERVRLSRLAALLEPIARRAARWAKDHLDAIREADPEVPEEITSDRACDNWRYWRGRIRSQSERSARLRAAEIVTTGRRREEVPPMPGMRDRNLRSGDLHEELGIFLLKDVALVARRRPVGALENRPNPYRPQRTIGIGAETVATTSQPPGDLRRERLATGPPVTSRKGARGP